MNKFKALAVMAFLFVGMVGTAFAQNDATHTVNIEVQAINEITIGGDVTLTIFSATAGGAPVYATGSTSYALTTNDLGGSTRITAEPSVDPSSLGPGTGFDLKVSGTAPTGGAGSTDVSLSTTPQDVVTSIDAVSESGMTL